MTIDYFHDLSWGISVTVSFHNVKREEFKIFKNSKYSRQAEIHTIQQYINFEI